MNTCTERARYAETDQMGVVHHSVYLFWMEIGRTELLREEGLSYHEMESRGVMLPVSKLGCKYISPCYYDDVVEICSAATLLTRVKLRVDYKIYRKSDKALLFEGYTEHAVLDKESRKIMRAPEWFQERVMLEEDFQNRI